MAYQQHLESVSLLTLFDRSLYSRISSVVMASSQGQYANQASRRNTLQAGTYRFTRENVGLITQLHDRDSWSLWDIKDIHFIDATLQQLAVAIVQGRFDANNVQFKDRPRFTFIPSNIDLDEFNVGVRPQWYDLPQ